MPSSKKMTDDDGERLYRASEVAKLLKIKSYTVRSRLIAGEIKGTFVRDRSGRRWWTVKESDLRDYVSRRFEK